MMCSRVVWLELDRSLVFAHRPAQIDFAKEEYFAKRGVRFGEVGIKTKSFEGGLFRFRRSTEPVRACVKGGQNIGARETRVSERIIWIVCDCLFVKRNRFRDVIARPLFPKRSAFVIKLVRFCVVRRLGGDHLLLRAGEFR